MWIVVRQNNPRRVSAVSSRLDLSSMHCLITTRIKQENTLTKSAVCSWKIIAFNAQRQCKLETTQRELSSLLSYLHNTRSLISLFP